jgi:hypothetical protein
LHTRLLCCITISSEKRCFFQPNTKENMKTLKREFLTRKNFCYFFAIIFAGILVTSCTAEDLTITQDQEIVLPDEDVKADGDVDGNPPVVVSNPFQPPKK